MKEGEDEQGYEGKEEAPLIRMEEFREWIVNEDADVLVVNKPGWVVCHPSKNGPYSSLVGVAREYSGLERLHLVSRLDRETSGVVVLAKHGRAASFYQVSLEKRRARKVYVVIMKGEMKEGVYVDQPLAKDIGSKVHVKQVVREDRTAQKAQTYFYPLVVRGGYTLAVVKPVTGRKHQIRAHAEWLGLPVVGDKLYGGDESIYLEFVEKGRSERLMEVLGMERQALHAYEMGFELEGGGEIVYRASLWGDMVDFCEAKLGVGVKEIEALIEGILGEERRGNYGGE